MGFDPSLSGAGGAFDFVCTGIAQSGAEIINSAIENGALDGVLGAEMITRHEPFEHDAIRVQFEDGDEVILDFWQTLDPSNPVTSTVEDWCNDSCGGL